MKGLWFSLAVLVVVTCEPNTEPKSVKKEAVVYKKARMETCGGCEERPVKVFIAYRGRKYDNF